MSGLKHVAAPADDNRRAHADSLRRRIMVWFVSRAQRRALQELERMDDRLLRDMGLDRDTLRQTLRRRPMD